MGHTWEGAGPGREVELRGGACAEGREPALGAGRDVAGWVEQGVRVAAGVHRALFLRSVLSGRWGRPLSAASGKERPFYLG